MHTYAILRNLATTLLLAGSAAAAGCASGDAESVDVTLSSEDGKFDHIDGKQLRLVRSSRDPMERGEHVDSMEAKDAGDKVVVRARSYEASLYYQEDGKLDNESLEPTIYEATIDGACGADEMGEGCDAELGFVLVRNALAPWSAEEQPLANCGGSNFYTSVLIDTAEKEVTVDGTTYSFESCGLRAYPQSESGWRGDYVGISIYPVPLSADGRLSGTHAYNLRIDTL